MNLPPDYLTRPHVVFDVESFGLHGSSFAVGAVLVKFELWDRQDIDEIVVTPKGKVVMRELQHFAATDRRYPRPWAWVPGDDEFPSGARSAALQMTDPIHIDTFIWLQENIPDSVFEPHRLTGDLSIFELFDAFVEAAGPDVMLWAEVPVPVEANFLNALRWGLLGSRQEFWKGFSAPILHDIASLADPLLGLSINRLPHHLPAHDPLNDARASAERLRAALSRIVRLQE